MFEVAAEPLWGVGPGAGAICSLTSIATFTPRLQKPPPLTK